MSILQQPFQIDCAPLQGCTDHIFRQTHQQFFKGVNHYYTPFIRIEPYGFRPKDLRELQLIQNDKIQTIPQILPGSGKEMEVFIKLLKDYNLSVCDINFGCPFSMITKRHRGSGILTQPNQILEIVDIINQHPEIKFSIKMRLGWDTYEQGIQTIQILNKVSLSHITLHARLGIDQYKDQIRLDEFASLLTHTTQRIIYNGDLNTINDIHEIRAKFPQLAGISLGRGLIAHPWLAEELISPQTRQMQMIQFQKFHNQLIYEYQLVLQGDHQLLKKMQTFWEYFLPCSDRKLLKAIKKAGSLKNYEIAVNQLFNKYINNDY